MKLLKRRLRLCEAGALTSNCLSITMKRTKKHISTKLLLAFIRRNPGLTAGGYSKLLDYNWGTMSSRLYKLCKTSDLERLQDVGMRSDIVKAWRYSISVL